MTFNRDRSVSHVIISKTTSYVLNGKTNCRHDQSRQLNNSI